MTPVYYVIIHKSGKSYLSLLGWVSSFVFARKFSSFIDTHNFIVDCSLYDQGAVIGRVEDCGYGPEVERVID